MDKAAFLAEWERFNRIVHDIVAAMNGSISAEHGIGLIKRDELLLYKDPVALDLMRTLKRALDPAEHPQSRQGRRGHGRRAAGAAARPASFLILRREARRAGPRRACPREGGGSAVRASSQRAVS